VTGSLTFQDPGAGVSIAAASFGSLTMAKVDGGISCTITGEAEVTRGGSTTSEPFTATCLDATSGDSFAIQTSSYQGGGAVSGGSVKVG
jgi:hypothetical protein